MKEGLIQNAQGAQAVKKGNPTMQQYIKQMEGEIAKALHAHHAFCSERKQAARADDAAELPRRDDDGSTARHGAEHAAWAGVPDSVP